MSQVKRPAIVGLNKPPALPWQPQRQGIFLDISDRPAHFVWMVQEHFPSPSSSPSRMVGGAEISRTEPLAAGLLESFCHLLSQVFVLAQKQMDMVGHDRARITGVVLVVDHLGKGIGNRTAVGLSEVQQRMFEHVSRVPVEFPDITSCWLYALSAMMKFAQIGNEIVTNCPRAASARIVGQPPAVGGPDQ